jgi:acyl-CoA thioesterase-1
LLRFLRGTAQPTKARPESSDGAGSGCGGPAARAVDRGLDLDRLHAARPQTARGKSQRPTKSGVANLDRWLGTGKWDVIHFNHGIHDLRHMPDGKRQVEPADYEKNLRAIVERLKTTGAKLIFATTTPIPDGELNPKRTFGKVAEYNEIALRVMNENGVAINDLNAWITPRFAELQVPKDLHYQPQGYEFLAQKVATEISKALGL